MDAPLPIDWANPSTLSARECEAVLRRFTNTSVWPVVLSITITICFFLADLLLPRGATPAIGYCLVPVIAVGLGRRDFLIAMMIACTVLTWVGYVLEPAGGPAWMSVFERSMVTGVLWLTLAQVWRRAMAVIALAEQAQLLCRVQKELERSNRELDSFASVVAHDMRGPLNTISLLAHCLEAQQPVKQDAESQKWLLGIEDEVQRSSGLIQSVLTYARIGCGEIKLTDCDCERVLDEVRESLRAEFQQCDAVVSNDPLPQISADPALMRDLFQNLIENSLKYRGSSSPRVHVCATRDGDGWSFAVSDNGIGIDGAHLERIFDRFQQAPGGSRGGIGLGLATCKRIVERHGGTIRAESTPGHGATFTFTIRTQPNELQCG